MTTHSAYNPRPRALTAIFDQATEIRNRAVIADPDASYNWSGMPPMIIPYDALDRSGDQIYQHLLHNQHYNDMTRMAGLTRIILFASSPQGALRALATRELMTTYDQLAGPEKVSYYDYCNSFLKDRNVNLAAPKGHTYAYK